MVQVLSEKKNNLTTLLCEKNPGKSYTIAFLVEGCFIVSLFLTSSIFILGVLDFIRAI